MNNSRLKHFEHGKIFLARTLVFCLVVLCFFITACVPGPYQPSPRVSTPAVNNASFSPDGKLIVLSMANSKSNSIFLASHAGKVLKILRLDTVKSWNGYPVFSPVGSKIAFVSTQADKHGDIYIMDVDGDNVRRLTHSSHYDRWPCFSTDGEKIFFARAKFFGNFSPVARKGLHDNDIHSVDIEDGKELIITNQKLYNLNHINTFPIGDKLLVGVFNEAVGPKDLQSPPGDASGHNIWTLLVDKPRRWRPIIPDLKKFKADPKMKPHAKVPVKYSSLYNPVLSHDGKYLIFSWWGHYNDLYGTQLYITDMDTMETRMLTQFQTDTRAVDFSPDNKSILFLANPDDSSGIAGYPNNLWLINRDGTGLRRIKLDFSAVLKQKPPKP